MNKPVQILTKRLNLSRLRWMSFIFTFSVLSYSSLSAQVDCDVVMACNNQIQVSLGENCTELVVPDMILEDPVYPNSNYTVTVYRESGAVVVDNILRQPMIGERLSAKIKLTGCDNSCWGYLTVEDKLPPVITNCVSPVELECEDSTAPGVNVPRPTATDACTAVTLKHSDITKKLTCSSPYTMTITRSWVATDAYGNSATCSQTINILRASIDDVTFPDDYANGNEIECGTPIPYLQSGAPSPDYTGYPNGVQCPNINYYFEDVIFDLCGGGVKVLRQWFVVDWCTGRDTIGNQVIKVVDTRAPICTSPPDFVFEISTDPGLCTGTFDVPAPTVNFECSDYDYTVGYKLRDANGNPFQNPVYDNVERINNQDGSYFYRISDLPQDTSWIVYTITDACGFKTQCFTEVFVADKEKPTAICEGYSVVTLGSDGWADVFAESIDDHSKDNCDVVKYEVKRLVDNCGFSDDLDFGKKVKFCCEDVSEDPSVYTKVVLRVTDQAGNYNDCVANVKVEDKINPIISCPPGREIQCGTDDSPTITGTATGSDNCSVEISHSDVRNLNDCGQGTISRRWTAKDPGGRIAACTQTIKVIDFTPFNASNVMFPNDITINGCSPADADPVLLNSFPTITNDDCVKLAISYEDEEFQVPGSCFKITRRWRIADWCTFNAQNPSYIEGSQIITFRNSEAPVFVSDCTNRVIESNDTDCEEYVEHSADATDDCTPADRIKYTWEYDEDADGKVDATGTGAFTANVYPTGRHKFTFFATDLCNNTSSCSYFFTIRDGKAPTPICHREVVWVIDDQGQAEVWASDFNLKSFDLCDGEDLRYSFDSFGSQAALDFDCDDIPNGISAEIDLRMYVWDSSNNSEYCEVVLVLQDSPLTNACDDDPFANSRIAGNIMHHDNNGMLEAEVNIVNTSNNHSQMVKTDDQGHFEYDAANFYQDYNVAPTYNKDILNGVSTLDLVLIQRHILGMEEIDEATKLISADINNDQKVSSADLVALRKVILGITNTYQNNNSYRFMPAQHEFDDPTYPWGFPEEIDIIDIMRDNMESNFYAIKIGDVNQSVQTNLRENSVENRSEGLDIIVDNTIIPAGTETLIPVIAGEDYDLFGIQLYLESVSENLEIKGIQPGILNIGAGHYHVMDNAVKLSYDMNTALELRKEDVLFYIRARGIRNTESSSLKIADGGLVSESYNKFLEEGNINLAFRTDLEEVLNTSIANNPNPFQNSTSIEYNASVEGNGVLKIMDASGKLISNRSLDLKKGINNINVTADELNNTVGIYFYSIETNGIMLNGKMILIK